MASLTPRISPDGDRVAFARAEGSNIDIWIADLRRASTTRLTFDDVTDPWPVWSPDGTTITYSSGPDQGFDLYRRGRDGTELYYWGLDGRIMAAAVDGSGPAYRWTTPITLFQAVVATLRTNDINFDVAIDGRRFLLVEPADRVGSHSLMVITDWLAAMK